MTRYKACEPIQTINNIRNKLYELGILLKEKHYENSNLFHACKVSIYNNGLENMGVASNGKGLDLSYCLASAYGEFMERLQNNMLFSNQLYASKGFVNSIDESSYFKKYMIEHDLTLDFRYDPNEKSISVEESIINISNFYKNLFPFVTNENGLIDFIKNDLGYDKLLSVPFFSVDKKKEVFLPMELCLAACGSNGMSGGNTKHEALIQGFCEIFERYAGRKLYFEKITPPDIPIDYFKDTVIYDKLIKLISDKKYNIRIKDCSLGEGLPVIGILVTDTERGKYNFHLGSSLSPVIALERCLTEIHQNPQGIYWNNIYFGDLSHDFIEKDEFIFFNGNQIFADGTGIWPKEIFLNTPTYPFNGLNDSLNQSDEVDMDFITKKISSLGFDIYIRDVSFLGFPSYYVIVPGMSEYPVNRKHYLYLGNAVSALKKVKNLKNLTDEELFNICTELNKNYYSLKIIGLKFQTYLFYHNNYDIHDLDFELFLFMLNYRTGNFDKALLFISKFLDDKNKLAYRYYFGLRDYLLLLMQNLSLNEIKQTLVPIYNEEAEEIIEDMKEPSKIFQHYEWPTCFNCESCEIMNECKYFDAIRLVKKIQQIQKANIIDHKDFVI